MNEAAISPVAINELLPKRFVVPAYQRGYRWKEQQVRDLLDDIWEFEQRAIAGTFYCLQPLVAQQRADGAWELIDGQQRLTTIYLILTALELQMKYLEKERFSLRFATREATSGDFLQKIDPARALENVDFYYLTGAHRVIQEWFLGKDGNHKRRFLNCLLNDDASGPNVRVIWYELPPDADPIEAFTRLNAGKIPLTNAELVRALFLRRGNFEGEGGALAQTQLAHEWDAIEKSLQREEFWYFLHSGEDAPPTHIEYLFQLMAREQPVPGLPVDDPLHTFHVFHLKLRTGDRDGHAVKATALWQAVKEYGMTFEEWFQDRVHYHLIGWLVHQGDDLLEVRKLGSAAGKRAFQQALRGRIFAHLLNKPMATVGETELALKDLCERLEYGRHTRQIRAVLLLFNVATLLANSNSNVRFPFDRYKIDQWDLEHVRSVADDKPNRPDTRRAWLELNLQYLTGPTASAEKKAGDLRQRIEGALAQDDFSEARFDALHTDLLAHFDEGGDLEGANGIGNLTLLRAQTNRSYRNAVFPVKRVRILAEDKSGSFVPVCTRSLFLKAYSKAPGRMLAWRPEDAEDYRAEIIATLTRFFHPNP